MLYLLDNNFEVKELSYVLQNDKTCYTENEIQKDRAVFLAENMGNPLIFNVDVFSNKERAVEEGKLVLLQAIERVEERLKLLKDNLVLLRLSELYGNK